MKRVVDGKRKILQVIPATDQFCAIFALEGEQGPAIESIQLVCYALVEASVSGQQWVEGMMAFGARIEFCEDQDSFLGYSKLQTEGDRTYFMNLSREYIDSLEEDGGE